MDSLSPKARSLVMSRIHGKDTNPELAVRRIIKPMRLPCRFHDRLLPGCPDIVFPSQQKVILIHGCFWHRHRCRKGRSLPKTRSAFWKRKLECNRLRDRRCRRALSRKGWHVLVVWECQLRNVPGLVGKIAEFLGRTPRGKTRKPARRDPKRPTTSDLTQTR